VPKFDVFMEQPTNTDKFIDMNNDLGKGGDNKLIHDGVADGNVHDGEGFGGGDKQNRTRVVMLHSQTVIKMDGRWILLLRNRQFVKPLYPRKTCLEDKGVSGERLH
jgi:hypothetical protein